MILPFHFLVLIDLSIPYLYSLFDTMNLMIYGRRILKSINEKKKISIAQNQVPSWFEERVSERKLLILFLKKTFKLTEKCYADNKGVTMPLVMHRILL